MSADRVAAERKAGPPLGGRPGRHQFHGHPERPQDFVHLLLLAGRAEVEPAGGQDELLARLAGQLPPQPLGLAGQPDVERIGIGPPEDPGAAVRAAAPVPGLERLQDGHRAPAADQCPRRGRPGQPGSDDHHVHPVSAHGSTVALATEQRPPAIEPLTEASERRPRAIEPLTEAASSRTISAYIPGPIPGALNMLMPPHMIC